MVNIEEREHFLPKICKGKSKVFTGPIPKFNTIYWTKTPTNYAKFELNRTSSFRDISRMKERKNDIKACSNSMLEH